MRRGKLELAAAIVVVATAAAIFLSLVRDKAVGFLAFVAGCAVSLVWASLSGGMKAVGEVFGFCISAGVIWGALEMFVIENLRHPSKRG